MQNVVRAAFGLVAVAVSLTACAPSYTSQAGRSQYQAVRGPSGNTLARPEMVAAEVGRNAYDVISFLRPQFLRGHKGVPTLSINGVLVGPATYLTTMSADEIEEVKLINGLDATTLFGGRHTGSVLMVTTRRR